MIFQTITIQNLQDLLEPHMQRPLWPGITDVAVKERAREYAHQSGLWDRLTKTLASDGSLPALRFSEYQNYPRTGSREPHQSSLVRFADATDMAALAIWLDHPQATVDRLQDLMWEWCGSDWTMPSHKGLHIELFGTRVGRMLCEYDWLFADRLDEMLRQRVRDEVMRRMLDVALDWRRGDWWNTGENNWNLVCNTDLVQMALYLVHDSKALATFVHTICRRLDYALAYFPADGGCPEGPGYWEYGFLHFLNLAVALRQRTGGKVDLMADEHVRAICRAPLAMQLRGPLLATFADAGNGYLAAETALKVEHLTGSPNLFRCVEPLAGGMLRMDNIRALSLFTGQRYDATIDRTDYYLPALAYAKFNGEKDTVLAVAAGNNGVSHNHNDIGSFIFLVGESAVLVDPGAPVYNAKTFSPNRYEMLFCRSRGHSVPLINGHEQSPGKEFVGTMQVSGLNESVEKAVRIDMTLAYADPTLQELSRELRLSGDVLRLTDTYRFSALPSQLEEAFMTFEPAMVADDGKSVVIGRDVRVRLEAGGAGTFAIQTYPPEAHEGQDRRPVSRIVFTPAQLATGLVLAFTCGVCS